MEDGKEDYEYPWSSWPWKKISLIALWTVLVFMAGRLSGLRALFAAIERIGG